MRNGCTKTNLGQRIQMLRNRTGLSVRQLAKQAGVTAAMISLVERNKNSPSIAMLQKILSALGTDLSSFFGSQGPITKGPIIRREAMRLVVDPQRSYTIVFPPRQDIHIEILDEQILPARRKPPFEILQCDVAGLIISGILELDIAGQPCQSLRPGDAFYLPKGTKHRGYALQGPVRLITNYHPARY